MTSFECATKRYQPKGTSTKNPKFNAATDDSRRKGAMLPALLFCLQGGLLGWAKIGITCLTCYKAYLLPAHSCPHRSVPNHSGVHRHDHCTVHNNHSRCCDGVLGYQQLLKVTNFTQLLVALEFWTLFTVRILLAFIGMNLHEFQT